jgi:hypothetical protein
MSDRRLEARAMLSAWFEVVVVCLLVVALVGGWAAYTAHVDPGTTTEERVTGEWRATGDFEHSAAVTAENPVYDTGERLSNRSTYFTGITPELDGRFLTAVRADSVSDLSVSLDTALVFRSADEGEVYWRTERPLTERTVEEVSGGASVAVPFSVNVTQVESRLDRIGESLGGSPADPTAFVAVDVTVRGTINGQRQVASFTERFTITPAGGTYSVSEPEDAGERIQRTDTVTVPVEHGPLRSLGGPLVGLAALAGLGTLAVARRRGELDLSETERARLAYRSDRSEFDEWISQFRLPDVVFEKPRAEAESLRDLVDLAIDTDAAVVESPDESAYYVVGDQLLYVYEPPGRSGPPSGNAGTDEASASRPSSSDDRGGRDEDG